RVWPQLLQPQLLQPHELTPSIRSSNSKPKLWVHRPRPSTTVPINTFHFIEPCLLYDGTIELSHFPCQPQGGLKAEFEWRVRLRLSSRPSIRRERLRIRS